MIENINHGSLSMNEPFLIFLALGFFFTYKVVKGITSYLEYKSGKTIEAKVIKTEWINTPIIKFSSLYPKEQLRIAYRFSLHNSTYEKEEEDIHFKFKKGRKNRTPKENDLITVFAPKSNNPNKVTMNQFKDTIKPIIALAALALLAFGIAALIIFNQ